MFLKRSLKALMERRRPNAEDAPRSRRRLWKMSRNGWLLLPLLLMALPGCGGAASDAEKTGEVTQVTESTRISDVIGNPLFGDWGRLLFPVNPGYWGGDTLGSLSLAWYSHIRTARTVGIVNVLREQASAGNRIFYRIYSEEEMRADPRKADTGLSEVTGEEPPTCSCVGTDDGIASYRTMQERTRRIRAQGTDAEIEVFDGLPHGFGLGEGTVAEGWLDRAVAFWERQMR